MEEKKEVCYVIAAKIGTPGIGKIAYYALKGLEKSKINYKAFCRGYSYYLDINKKRITNYIFLEYLSYPLRFIEKMLKMNIDSFKIVNSLFSWIVFLNIPKTRIYHSWIGVGKDAAKKSKKEGAILILEGANSHPLNILKILKEDYKKYLSSEKIKKIEENLKKEAEFIRIFDYILCPSNFVYNSFLKEGFRREQLILLPYGVDINDFSPKKEKKDKIFRAIFVGSVQLRKGVHYLLQAWDKLKLKNAELLIVGRIWPDAKEAIKKYKNNKTIKFIGFANPKEYYKKSDVFVFPSLEEGSALVTYEAMASGLPIITTFNSGSIARNGKEGFIVPIRDVKALKKRILYFYKNPEVAEKMGKAARKRVENFTWEKYGENLVKAYKKILKKNK
ncbi:MAG: glycosyltransferase family 4 protein [Candidatus Pacearchaeota archaeon]